MIAEAKDSGLRNNRAGDSRQGMVGTEQEANVG